MRFVVVTGMSGGGKSTALKMLEDMGYFCVDNLPVPLIPKLAELLAARRRRQRIPPRTAPPKPQPLASSPLEQSKLIRELVH